MVKLQKLRSFKKKVEFYKQNERPVTGPKFPRSRSMPDTFHCRPFSLVTTQTHGPLSVKL